MPQPTKEPDEYQREPLPAALDGFYVVRGFNKDHAFGSILDLPEKEAIAVMEKDGGFRGKGPADANGKRDQKVYYDDRKATDTWVREQSGVSSDRANPVFFALTNDPEHLLKLMGNGYANVMVVPLKELEASKWTFTFDDSMGNFFSKPGADINENNSNFLSETHPLHGKVMNVAQVAEAVAKYGTNLNSGQPREIEAQFWGKDFDPELKGGYVAKSKPSAIQHHPDGKKEQENSAAKKPEPEGAKKSRFMKPPKPAAPAQQAKKAKSPSL